MQEHAGAQQARAAPSTSRVAGTTCRRGGAVSHYPNSWSRCTKGFQGAMSPRASRAQPCRPRHKSASPAQKRSRRQRPCTHANRSPECTPAPPHAAHCRAEPEEPRRSAGAPQTRGAPSKSRPQPVGSARAGAKCQSPRVTWRHDGHNLFCDTCSACAAQTRVVNPRNPATPLEPCSNPQNPPLTPAYSVPQTTSTHAQLPTARRRGALWDA